MLLSDHIKGDFWTQCYQNGLYLLSLLKKKQKQKQKMSSIYNTPTNIIKLRHSFFLQEEAMLCS